MRFKQFKDGSCDIIFEDHEVEIIKKHKKLNFSAEMLRHFGNCLVNMVTQWQLAFDEDIKKLATEETTKLTGRAPDEDV